MVHQVTVMTPVVFLGSQGINPDAFKRALTFEPDVIALDAGSLGYGPCYLGTGTPFAGRNQVKSDLDLVIPPARERGIPIIIGSAGGSGTTPHVEWCLDIIREIRDDHELELDVTTIHSDIDPDDLTEGLETRDIRPVDHDEPLSAEDVRTSDHIVGQMGVEPFVDALTDFAVVVDGALLLSKKTTRTSI